VTVTLLWTWNAFVAGLTLIVAYHRTRR